MKKYPFIFVILLAPIMLHGQFSASDSTGIVVDSTEALQVEKESAFKSLFYGTPGKAALRSLIVPGLGQAYNKKHWKIPIVYAAYGTGVGFIIYNQRRYKDFKYAYEQSVDDLPIDASVLKAIDIEIIEQFDQEGKRELRNRFDKYTQQSYLAVIGIHLLQVMEAFTDAHLIDFDVDDNLSLSIQPSYTPITLSGVNLGMNFSYKF